MASPEMELGQYLAQRAVELGILSGLAGFVANRWSVRYSARVNADHARELEAVKTAHAHDLQHAKAHLDSAVAVTTARFEAESQVVADLWKDVHRLREAFLRACVPSARYIRDEPSDPPERDQWLVGRVDKMIEVRNAYQDALHTQELQLSSGTYDALAALVDRCDEHIRRVWRDQFSSDWFDHNDRLRNQFYDDVTRAKDTIRARFDAMGLPMPAVAVPQEIDLE